MTMALTGVTGGLGARVLRELGSRHDLRVLVRDLERAPQGFDARQAAYEDTEAMRAALAGVDTLFLVSGHESLGRADLQRGAVAAAADAGVRRVVYTSFMGAAPAATFTYARDHSVTERAVVEAGMALTSLRSALYADVVPWFVGPDDALRGPAGDGRVAWVAREDVARLAAAVLVDESHANSVYDVSGPRAMSLDETAGVLSRVVGRPFTYVPQTRAQAYASRAGAGEPWQIEGWVSSYEAVATGETSVTSHTVQAVTGRRPWTLEEFLRAEPKAWAHLRR